MPASSNFLSPHELRQSLADAARFLHAKGWTPATSSNFSLRLPDNSGLAISVSGLDKGRLSAEDFLELPFEMPSSSVIPFSSTKKLQTTNARPSAETPLHAMIYQHIPQAQTVLHTHSLDGTVLSKLYESQGGLWLKNFELLKAFEGIRTHETKLWLPIFPNSQNMDQLSLVIAQDWLAQPSKQPCYGFLLAGHGLYTWGQNTVEALRHAEAFEFLMTAVLKLKSLGYSALDRQ